MWRSRQVLTTLHQLKNSALPPTLQWPKWIGLGSYPLVFPQWISSNTKSCQSELCFVYGVLYVLDYCIDLWSLKKELGWLLISEYWNVTLSFTSVFHLYDLLYLLLCDPPTPPHNPPSSFQMLLHVMFWEQLWRYRWPNQTVLNRVGIEHIPKQSLEAGSWALWGVEVCANMCLLINNVFKNK